MTVKTDEGLPIDSLLTIAFPDIEPCPIKKSPLMKEKIPNNNVDVFDFKKLPDI